MKNAYDKKISNIGLELLSITFVMLDCEDGKAVSNILKQTFNREYEKPFDLFLELISENDNIKNIISQDVMVLLETGCKLCQYSWDNYTSKGHKTQFIDSMTKLIV